MTCSARDGGLGPAGRENGYHFLTMTHHGLMAKACEHRQRPFSHNMVNGKGGINVWRSPGRSLLVENFAYCFNIFSYIVETNTLF
jgi:hypothetical protein